VTRPPNAPLPTDTKPPSGCPSSAPERRQIDFELTRSWRRSLLTGPRSGDYPRAISLRTVWERRPDADFLIPPVMRKKKRKFQEKLEKAERERMSACRQICRSGCCSARCRYSVETRFAYCRPLPNARRAVVDSVNKWDLETDKAKAKLKDLRESFRTSVARSFKRAHRW